MRYKEKRNQGKKICACYISDERSDRKVTKFFHENKKVKRVRKGTSGKEEKVKIDDCKILIEKES